MLALYALDMAQTDRRHRVCAIYSSATGGKLWPPPTVEPVEQPSKMTLWVGASPRKEHGGIKSLISSSSLDDIDIGNRHSKPSRLFSIP